MKDRSVLKVVHLSNNTNSKVSFKECEADDGSMYVPFTSRPGLASEITYQRLSRLGRVPSTTSVPSTASRNDSIEEKSTASTPDNSQTTSSHSSSRSLSEPRRRIAHQTPTNSHLTGQ